MTAPYRSRLLLPETLPFTDARERRWFYNYRGAGGPFVPMNLSGLRFWLRSDRVTKDASDKVSAVADLSGAGLIASATQSTGANQPTWVGDAQNGLPVIRFASTGSTFLTMDGLSSLFTGTDQPFSLCLAAKTTTASQTMFSAGSGSSSTPTLTFETTTVAWRSLRRDDANVASTLGGDVFVTTFAIHSIVFTGTHLTWRVNGAATIDADADVGAMTLNRVTLGALRRTTTAAYWDGDFGEMFGAGRAFDAGETTAAEGYLAARWGVTLA